MLKLVRTERKTLTEIAQHELRHAIVGGTFRPGGQLPTEAPRHAAEKLGLPANALTLYIIQNDYSSSDEPLVYSREYHLPDVFDFVVWRRGPTKPRAVPSDGDA